LLFAFLLFTAVCEASSDNHFAYFAFLFHGNGLDPCLLFNITVIQAYAPTSNSEEAELERFYEDLQDPLELTPRKYILFIIGDWNAKVGSEETPGVTGKFGLVIRNEEGQRLKEFCQENTLVIANTLFQQHKRRLYTWTSPDGQQQNQIDYILCSQRWRSSIQSKSNQVTVG